LGIKPGAYYKNMSIKIYYAFKEQSRGLLVSSFSRREKYKERTKRQIVSLERGQS